jgi:hypothetical protein
MRIAVALPLILIISVAFILPTATTRASLIGYTYDQIQYESDLIILGRVTGSTNYLAYQLRRVAVECYLKGNGPPIIEVKELGGDIGGGISIWVEDQPELSIGTTYVLFLTQRNGFNYITGGPQGALKVEGDVARNARYALRVTNTGLVPVATDEVTPTGFTNRTALVARDPAMLVIFYNDEGPIPGYWTFNVTFVGASGEAAGITEERHLSDFLMSREQGAQGFYQNFTAPGHYRLIVDGAALGELEVGPPNLQIPLVKVTITPNPTVGEVISFNVTAGKANVSGELRAIVAVSPIREGAEPFYQSYADCRAGYPQFFGFNMVIREAGNYTLTFWQNGVKQMTREITVDPMSVPGASPNSPEDGAGIGEEELSGRSPPGPASVGLSLVYVLPWLVGVIFAIWLLLLALSSVR